MNQIQRRIAFNGLPRGDHRVFAAGPLSLQPGGRPYRIVMVKWDDDKISVHQESFDVKLENVKDLAFDCSDAESSFDNGEYFKPEEMPEAQRSFGKKIERHAQFTESCFREDA